MKEMEEFLESLTDEQLSSLRYLLEDGISGDIDYFIFRIHEEANKRY